MGCPIRHSASLFNTAHPLYILFYSLFNPHTPSPHPLLNSVKASMIWVVVIVILLPFSTPHTLSTPSPHPLQSPHPLHTLSTPSPHLGEGLHVMGCHHHHSSFFSTPTHPLHTLSTRSPHLVEGLHEHDMGCRHHGSKQTPRLCLSSCLPGIQRVIPFSVLPRHCGPEQP